MSRREKIRRWERRPLQRRPASSCWVASRSASPDSRLQIAGGSAKAKTLVKLLALAPGHRLHRDIVVDLLWPEAEPQATANNLHQLVHAIRRMMGTESITVTDDVVRLCPAGGLLWMSTCSSRLPPTATDQEVGDRA